MSVWCSRIPLPTILPRRPRRRPPLPPIIPHLHSAAASDAAHRRVTNGSGPSPPTPVAYRALSPQQQDQIRLFVDALLQWNQRMNLTAVTEESEVMARHVQDSLALLPPLQRAYLANCSTLPSCDGLRLIDVGSGAGLPGLILAIARPGWSFTLLESMHKRCEFMQHIVGLTNLSNVQIIRDRAENIGQCVDFRETFDVALARAVAELRILAEYCLPLVRVGGLFVAAKGSDPKEEIKNGENAVHLLGGSVLELCDVESHGPFGKRTAVIYLKDHATPRKYPRHPGTPSKMPL